MAVDSWMDTEADRLQKKADRLLYRYKHLDNLARRRIGDSRHELLEQMAEASVRHSELLSQIARLRGRVKI